MSSCPSLVAQGSCGDGGVAGGTEDRRGFLRWVTAGTERPLPHQVLHRQGHPWLNCGIICLELPPRWPWCLVCTTDPLRLCVRPHPGFSLAACGSLKCCRGSVAARCDCEARPRCGDWWNGVNEASIPRGCLCQDTSSYVSLSPAGGAPSPLPGQEAGWALREAGAWSGSHRTRGQSCSLSPALSL